MNCELGVALRVDATGSPLKVWPPKVCRAFTLIEIMVVVAIIGLVAAMGMPSMLKALQKDGMRKAISDLTEVCQTARANAVLHSRAVSVIFKPGEKSFSAEGGKAEHAPLVAASKLPDSVEFAMLDINQQDCSQRDQARVRFYPNGTSDEMTIVLHDRFEWQKITLEFATGITTVSAVDK